MSKTRRPAYANRKQDLVSRPIPELIRMIATPASVGYFFHTMYNVADTYFGGLISTEAVAALSLSFPVYFIILSVGNGLATGNTALIGNALGEGREDEARLYAAQGVTFGIITAAVMTVSGRLAAPWLFRLLGADDAYLDICLEYMNPLLLGVVFFILLYMFNAVLQARGDTRTFRNFLIASCLANLVLDPWFVFGGFGLPAMGIRGIALATVLLIACGAAYLGYRAARTGVIGRDFLRLAPPRARQFLDIAHQGFPAGLNMMTIALGIFVITYFVSGFGREAVAAYGIGTRAVQIVLLPSIGLSIATLTITAQNHGAGRFDRIFATMNRTLFYGALIMAAGAVLVVALARPLIAAFTDDPLVTDIGATYLRIEAVALYGYVILSVHVSALQGVKRPLFAIWIGLGRQIAAPLIVFWLLTRELGFGVESIWWGIVAIVWTAALFALFYARRIITRARDKAATETARI
jgi:putative MATE family efflux protein